MSKTGTVYYYLRNAQGDITGIVNSSGTQVVDYTYEAWGVKMTRTGTMADTLGVLNPFRYRGYVYDEESGLLGDSGIRLRFCKRYYIWHSFLMERMNDGKVFRNEQTV